MCTSKQTEFEDFVHLKYLSIKSKYAIHAYVCTYVANRHMQ